MSGSTRTDARNTTRQFGACIVERSPGRVANLLALPAGSSEYQKMMDKLIDDECLGDGILTIPWTVMRGSLFEALYLHEFPRSGPSDFAVVAPIDYMAGYTPPFSGDVAAAIALARFGDCVARADPASARLLLVVQPGSTGEKAQLAALTPKLGPCIPQGETIRFSPSILRGALAEGLYRLSHAAATPPREG